MPLLSPPDTVSGRVRLPGHLQFLSYIFDTYFPVALIWGRALWMPSSYLCTRTVDVQAQQSAEHYHFWPTWLKQTVSRACTTSSLHTLRFIIKWTEKFLALLYWLRERLEAHISFVPSSATPPSPISTAIDTEVDSSDDDVQPVRELCQ